MARNPPDERLVFLALKTIFKGVDAQLRNIKKIRKHILNHQENDEVHSLIEEHNIDNVANAARVLLEQGIFSSTLKAKIRFPEVFDVSPAQSAERSASEAEAAKSEADAIKHATEGYQDELTTDLSIAYKEGEGVGTSTTVPQKRSLTRVAESVPSLYPVYLPLKSQHRLLTRVQAILESACYVFGRERMSDLLDRKGWDSSECVELSTWSHIFANNRESFKSSVVESLGKPLPNLLRTMAQLRHTAVHRIRVSAKTIEQFLSDAEQFAILLENDSGARALSRLRREANSILDELGRNKDLLESKLKERMKSIASQRAELDRLEMQVVQEMLTEDKNYKDLAGANLEEAIAEPESVLHKTAVPENETMSEPDVDVESFEARFEQE